MNLVLAAWTVEAGLISVRDLAQYKRLPLPSEFLATFIVFGALAALGGTSSGRRPAGAVAWGLVIATAINGAETWSKPGGGNATVPLFGVIGDFLAPAPGTAPAASGASGSVGAAASGAGASQPTVVHRPGQQP